MYKLLRSFLFLFDPERVHYFSMNALRIICSFSVGKKLISRLFSTPGVITNAATHKSYRHFNLNFKNPVGLGAGFDKNASYLNELELLGFGFVEIGTVTPLAQGGNEKPRLFRLPKDKALINRMGFNNEGVEAVVSRLKQWKNKNSQLIIGGNIGKNKITPNEVAWLDYEICFKALHDYVDYFVVNVSSPNTPGLRELQEKESLRNILTRLQAINNGYSNRKPILLKIAPDLTIEQLDDVISLAMEIKLDGLVATNTTISRENLNTGSAIIEKTGAGGLSGLPLKKHSTEIVQYISQKTKNQIPIIGSGGIFTAQDAKDKIAAGACLVQVWTGFVYEGPAIVKNICKGITD